MQIVWAIIDWTWFDAWRAPIFCVQHGQHFPIHSNFKKGQDSMFFAKVTKSSFMALKNMIKVV